MQVLLVLFRADGTRRDFPVRKRRIVLGRSNGCDMRIPLSSVSREHCEIVVADDAVTLRDLGSSNGTYRNDNRVLEAVLEAGDRIQLGPVHFVVVIDGKPAKVEPRPTRLSGGGGGAATSPAKPSGRSDKAKSKSRMPADDEALPLAEDEDEAAAPVAGLAAAASAGMADADEAAPPLADDLASESGGGEAADALAELQRHLESQEQSDDGDAASEQALPAAADAADELSAPLRDEGQEEAPLVAETPDHPSAEPAPEGADHDADGALLADAPDSASDATDQAMPLDQPDEQAAGMAQEAAADAVTVDADQPATASSDDTMDPGQEDVVAVGEDEDDEVEVVMEDGDDDALSATVANPIAAQDQPDAAPRSLDSVDAAPGDDEVATDDDASIDRPDTPASLHAAAQTRPEAPAGVAPRYGRDSLAAEPEDEEPSLQVVRPETPGGTRSAAIDDAAPAVEEGADSAFPVRESASAASPSSQIASEDDAEGSLATEDAAPEALADEEPLAEAVETASEVAEGDESLPVDDAGADGAALSAEPVEDDDPIAALARMAEAEQNSGDDIVPLADEEEEAPPPKPEPPKPAPAKTPPPKPKAR